MEMLHEKTTAKVLKAYFNVYNKLGFGFSERVYENSLFIELQSLGLKCEKQKAISVYYNGIVVGDYFADIVVDDCVILELKAGSGLVPEREAQLMNYLCATNIEVGMLLNFGEKPQFRRMLFTNDRKPHRTVA